MIVSIYLLVRGGEGYSSQRYTPVTLTPAAVTVNVTRTHAPGSYISGPGAKKLRRTDRRPLPVATRSL